MSKDYTSRSIQNSYTQHYTLLNTTFERLFHHITCVYDERHACSVQQTGGHTPQIQ